jgi:hypothetical protein
VNSLSPKELITINKALQNDQTNLREKMVILGFKIKRFHSASLLAIADSKYG